MFARYPVIWASNPRTEARAFQQQDPLPDPDIAPDGGIRPRDFGRPRTESRRAAEQRLFQGLRPNPGYVPPAHPTGGMRRPATVY